MERLKTLKTSFNISVIATTHFFLLTCTLAWSAEEINNYQSAIVVNKDGSLNVTETIQVTAEGNKIKRGIYRDFPTRYQKDAFL
ncbi:MAG: DUF2207 domain-containing protein, partial [Planctomycetales bacterium]